jgi:hypothetical protein
MRALRLAVLLLISVSFFLLVMGESRDSERALAQTAVTPVTIVPPAAPGQPAAFPTIGALPSLLPGPGTLSSIVATPLSTPRVFRCTCNGPGYPTEWAGPITAANYLLADNSASVACTNYKFNANAPSPFIAQRSSSITPTEPSLSTGSALNSSAFIGNSTLGSAINTNPIGFTHYQISIECSRCACN